MTSEPEHWEEIARKRRQGLLDQIPAEYRIPSQLQPPESQRDVTAFPRESGWFSQRELEITESTAASLLEKLAAQAWSSEDVTRAFCKRAAAAHQLTNCLSDVFFDEAIEHAQALDAHLRRTGVTVGPLHGLPVSLKDHFNVVGKDSTIGFTSLVGKPATCNSAMVELLEKAGAVRYCKTNVPTAMMISETVNNVFGRTVNPLNRALTSGGSSGGESALVAFGGSPLGVGSDIGGSLRIPAACTGIFTLRPSLGRFPTARCQSGLAGQEAIASVNGPMAHTLEDIALFAKVVVDTQPWLVDPKCVPIPWRAVEAKKKLKIAVLWHDGIAKPTPPIARALRETVDKLKHAGHEVVDWDPVLHLTALGLLGRMFLADGGKSTRALLEPTQEPFRPEMQFYEKATELGAYAMWQLHLERTELQLQYLEQWASHAGLDAILSPTTPYTSVANAKFKYTGYTGVYNLVDYAAVSFPCGVAADQEKDQLPADYTPLGDMCRDVSADYDAELVHGMPASLQLVARRLEEEKLLSMTATVLHAIHGQDR